MTTTKPPRIPERRRLVPPLLREREFRRFFAGQSASLFGDQVSLLALPLVGVLVLHASAAQMGYLTAAGLLPSLAFSLLAGAQMDKRGHHRRAMLAADLGRAALLGSIPITYLLGVLTLTQLYGVAFAVGTLDVLFAVSEKTLFVAMVHPTDYVAGNSLLNGSRAMCQVAGQSVAGLLVAALSAPGAILVDVVSFAFSGLTLGRIHPAEPPPATGGDSRFGAGANFIRHSAVMRAALGATATVNFFNFVFHALFVLYATRALHVPAGQLGLVLGIGAVGGVLGATLTGRLVRRLGLGPAFLLGCITFPAPLILIPAAGGPHWLVLTCLFGAEFGAGFGVMILDVTAGTLFAEVIPDPFRARVNGANRTLNYGVRPIGALTGGLLGTLLGLHTTLWIATTGGPSRALAAPLTDPPTQTPNPNYLHRRQQPVKDGHRQSLLQRAMSLNDARRARTDRWLRQVVAISTPGSAVFGGSAGGHEGESRRPGGLEVVGGTVGAGEQPAASSSSAGGATFAAVA
jgi:MFS family permease